MKIKIINNPKAQKKKKKKKQKKKVSSFVDRIWIYIFASMNENK